MIKLLLLALLLTFIASQTNYTYPYNGMANTIYAPPSFSLGALTAGQTLNITVSFPQAAGSTFNIQLRDVNNSVLTPGVVIPLSSAGTASYTVQTTGTYRLRITPINKALDVSIFYLAVLKNGASLLNVVDVLRNNIVKYIWLSQTTNLTVSHNGGPVTFYAMASTNKWSYATTVSGTLVQSAFQYQYTYSQLPMGYYTITVNTPSINSGYLEFRTNSYPCPYPTSQSDVYSIFTGCSSTDTGYTFGLPCTNNDFSTGACLSCLYGFTLYNGKCLTNTACGPRQYFHYGDCYPVDTSCNTFDYYTGACTSCVNSGQIVKDGQCVNENGTGNEITCPTNTHQYLTYCIPDSCAQGYTNGFCTRCISIAFQLSTSGICTAINCGSGYYFSIESNACLAIPSYCSDFSVALQKCQGCASGYFLNSSDQCNRPANSQNCKVFNFTSNKCNQCEAGYVFALTRCYQSTVMPVICAEGQIRVQEICITLPANCVSLDAANRCSQCISGYRLVSGQCVRCTGSNSAFPCVSCQSGQYIDQNGNCVRYGANCLSVNQTTGLCISCVNGAAPVNGKCCPYGMIIVNGFCLQNVQVNDPSHPPPRGSALYFMNCAASNPQLGTCTDCRPGYYFVSNDYCA